VSASFLGVARPGSGQVRTRPPSLQRDLGLENGYRLADDPDPFHAPVAKFQLHLDPARAMHRMSLDTGECRAPLPSRQQAAMRKVDAKQSMSVAADGILRNTQCRA